MKPTKKIHTGIIVDETIHFSLQEVCEICGIEKQTIIELVEFDILEPIGNRTSNWKFTADQLQRLQRALRLQHDLDLDFASVALVLQLLEELEQLRLQTKQLEKYLKLFNIKF